MTIRPRYIHVDEELALKVISNANNRLGTQLTFKDYKAIFAMILTRSPKIRLINTDTPFDPVTIVLEYKREVFRVLYHRPRRLIMAIFELDSPEKGTTARLRRKKRMLKRQASATGSSSVPAQDE